MQVVINFPILQGMANTKHEVVEYSEECTQTSSSSWAKALNGDDVEDKGLKFPYKKVELSLGEFL